MIRLGARGIAWAAAAAAMLWTAGALAQQTGPEKIEVTIESATGTHRFLVEIADSEAEQVRGLMYRTGIPPDGGMLFAPYPSFGGPREARFWMHNTPTPLDMIFIRDDGTIARIAANVAPFSDDRILSGEPVGAVLEINGGRAAELGIAVGDRVSWPEEED